MQLIWNRKRYVATTTLRWSSDNSSSRNNGFRRSIVHSFYILRLDRKPKGMVHTTAGYMVYTAYTLKNVLIMKKTIFWCTADIGWITGTFSIFCMVLYWMELRLLFLVEFYPDFSRFWEIIEKHKSEPSLYCSNCWSGARKNAQRQTTFLSR
jgi:hypothetical protein